MKKFKKLYAVLIAIAIPIIVTTAALNISFRSPEVYSYYFNESQAIDYTTLALTSNQLADQIADFAGDFFGDEVDITENAGYQDDPVFNDEEAEVLFELRSYLTKSLIVLLIALAIGISAYIILLKKEEGDLLFSATQISIAITGLAVLVSGILLKTQKFKAAFYSKYIDIPLPKDSVLKILFTKGDYFGTVDLVYVVMSLILLVITLYISWRLTKPYKIFK